MNIFKKLKATPSPTYRVGDRLFREDMLNIPIKAIHGSWSIENEWESFFGVVELENGLVFGIFADDEMPFSCETIPTDGKKIDLPNIIGKQIVAVYHDEELDDPVFLLEDGSQFSQMHSAHENCGGTGVYWYPFAEAKDADDLVDFWEATGTDRHARKEPANKSLHSTPPAADAASGVGEL